NFQLCKHTTTTNRIEEDSFGIPFDNRRTPTARDALLGMDSLNNEFLSQTIDSLLLEIPPSDFNFLDSKDKMSILKGEVLATNFGSTSDNSCDNAELSNNPFQHDFSVERLKPSWTYLNSKTFTEDCNFQTHAKSNFEKLYHCDFCLNKFHSKDILLKHKCIFSRDNPFQYEIYERNFSPTGNLSEIKCAHSNEKSFQCVICKQTLLQTDFEWHMLTHNASPNQGDISKEKISETEHFNRLMCTDTEKKLHQCQVCKKNFPKQILHGIFVRIPARNLTNVIYVCGNFPMQQILKPIFVHILKKPYQCHVCEKIFTKKLLLRICVRIPARNLMSVIYVSVNFPI
ncbi:zinc finger protein 84, partial [Trichonephila inaurata madagascariensis]